MSYGLEFLEVALDEWHSLDATLKRQLQKKLQSRLENPAAPRLLSGRWRIATRLD
jgi:mRNA-degrading endonuclease RelE of RelBE toxin-antitoxin system